MYLLSASSQKYLLTLWTHMESFKWGFFRNMQFLNLHKSMYLFCKWETGLWQEKVACIKFQGRLVQALKLEWTALPQKSKTKQKNLHFCLIKFMPLKFAFPNVSVHLWLLDICKNVQKIRFSCSHYSHSHSS